MQLLHYQSAFIAALPLLSGIGRAHPVQQPINGTNLNPSCRPGGNFDLSKWDLETAIEKGHGGYTTIPSAQLSPSSDACTHGWQDNGADHQWFYTNSTTGLMVIKAPGYSPSKPCIRTSGSEHCRTEFHELSPAPWHPSDSTNHLHVELAAVQGSTICIGQVFQMGTGSMKPYMELYYHPHTGVVESGVATCPGGSKAGCGQDMTTIGNVALGTIFTYDVQFDSDVLKIGVNGNMKTVKTHFKLPEAFFKFGNYNQGTDDATVYVSNVEVEH